MAANPDVVDRKPDTIVKTKLLILVSEKLGRGVTPTTSNDIIRGENEIAFLSFLRRMWRHLSGDMYFPAVYVALVTIVLAAATPAIYTGLSDYEKSRWVVLRTVAAIACDIVEALAIECTILFTAKTARELLCQLVLSIMGIAKTSGNRARSVGE